MRTDLPHRLRRWYDVRFFLGKFEVGEFASQMAMYIEGLGHLDCRLIRWDEEVLEIPESQRRNIHVTSTLAEHLIGFHLWVFGAYEVLRTTDQRIRSHPVLLQNPIAERIRETKRFCARVRVPLAKLEAASAHKATDYSVPGVSLVQGRGTAWYIADDTIVSRRDVSDRFLDCLEQLRAEVDRIKRTAPAQRGQQE